MHSLRIAQKARAAILRKIVWPESAPSAIREIRGLFLQNCGPGPVYFFEVGVLRPFWVKIASMRPYFLASSAIMK
ncbi:MAG: hypothetical protein JWL87_631 [Candidatus Adlerbacteria bacterium]|nr:hypothetical protein [Candidatus Adlerbacteria bacterium]